MTNPSQNRPLDLKATAFTLGVLDCDLALEIRRTTDPKRAAALKRARDLVYKAGVELEGLT